MAFSILLAIIGVLIIARRPPPTPTGDEQGSLSVFEKCLLYVGPSLLLLGIPLAQLLIPFWAWSKHKHRPASFPAVVDALNFQISWSLYLVVAMMLSLLLVGLPLMILLLAFHLYVMLKTIGAALQNKPVRFPYSLAFIPGGHQAGLADNQ